jgi:hypothetical protein
MCHAFAALTRDTETQRKITQRRKKEIEPRITRMNTDKKMLFSHPCSSVLSVVKKNFLLCVLFSVSLCL